MKAHLLYFPCREAVFDFFAETSGSGVAPVTIDLLAEQRTYESCSANRGKRITCHACNHPQARYVVCCRRGRTTDKLFPRRFPHSQRWHKPGCFSYSEELIIADDSETKISPPIVGLGSDFVALRRDLRDPEYSVVAKQRGRRAGNSALERSPARLTISLQRLARSLLQRSGLCEWRPHYAGARTERVFNGLIKGALNALAHESDLTSTVLNSLKDISFVPWSYLRPRDFKTPEAMTKCVGFGFVESLGQENEHGSRRLTLRNFPNCPVVVPQRILDREARNPRSPLLSFLAHPTWIIFVAEFYGGIWKAHALAAFRVSAVGLIPIDSFSEEKLVARLVGEGRSFVRYLLPPTALGGSRSIPDFQLLDTEYEEYLEVAGMMSSPHYAANIGRKIRLLGTRLIVWDTRISVDKLVFPSRVSKSSESGCEPISLTQPWRKMARI
ncbi:MAG: hypothetical protein Q8M02_01465 [Candidatus Didemnitutus sp.]|nr:hypothetical protein [Candidatus Didemnitutus sp.]